MSKLSVSPLRDDLSFGVRVNGVSFETLDDAAVRQQLNDLFEKHGLIVFENVEPSSPMHVAISNVFGELKPHPVPVVEKVDDDTMPGVIDMRHNVEEAGMVEVNGKVLSTWLPWHFDHCYNDELNRAGVLRAIDVVPEGGLTGFADGIELYRDLSPELIEKVGGCNVLYTLDMLYDHMRFGRPEQLRDVRIQDSMRESLEFAKTLPRSYHPAVWQRESGEKVLHVSSWMAVGIADQEDQDGDALLEAVCQEINRKVKPYYHNWKTTDMLIWDNWRMLHCVTGHDPKMPRRMQRTTIKGDYGLGGFENNGKGHQILQDTMV